VACETIRTLLRFVRCFQNSKHMTFYDSLSCCTRFLEHCPRLMRHRPHTLVNITSHDPENNTSGRNVAIQCREIKPTTTTTTSTTRYVAITASISRHRSSQAGRQTQATRDRCVSPMLALLTPTPRPAAWTAVTVEWSTTRSIRATSTTATRHVAPTSLTSGPTKCVQRK